MRPSPMTTLAFGDKMHSEHVSDEEWRFLERQLMEMVDNAMQSTPHTREIDAFQDGYQLSWEKQGMRMLVKKTATSAFHEFLALRKSPMTIDEYIELNYCDTTEEFRTQQALLYRDNLINASVLATRHARTDADPFRYLGLKYKRLRFAISGGVCEPRDTAFAEVSGLLKNKLGQRVLFIARDSLNLEDCPPVEHVVRFHFKTMILQTECDDYVEEAVYLFANPLGSIPAFVFNKVSQTSLTIVQDFPQMLQKKRTLEILASRPAPRKQSEVQKLKECVACEARFGSFRSSHDCVSCGYAMCSRCVVDLPRVVPGTLNTMSVVHDEVCKVCYVKTRQEMHFSGRSFQGSNCSVDGTDDSRDSAGHRSTVSTGNDLELLEDKASFLELDELEKCSMASTNSGSSSIR